MSDLIRRAVELVRQVDALPFPVMVIASKDSVSVVEPDETYLLPNPQQGSRTLNTIKAIVESKVLETDDE
jgi:SpoU rRNA methylase family enzyme